MSLNDKFNIWKTHNPHQNFQIKYPYSIYQVSPQQEESIGLEKSMKNPIQSENIFTQSINRLEHK